MFECGAEEGDGFVFESESCVVCALIKAVELGGVAVYGEPYELFSVRVVFAGERVKEVVCVFFKAAAAGVKGYVVSPKGDAFVCGDSFDDVFVGEAGDKFARATGNLERSDNGAEKFEVGKEFYCFGVAW